MKELHDVGPFFMPRFEDNRRLFPSENDDQTPKTNLNHPTDGCYDISTCVLGKICTLFNRGSVDMRDQYLIIRSSRASIPFEVGCF